MRSNPQRGFTLIETLIAITIGVVVLALLTTAIQWALQWGRTIATRQTEHAQFEALVDRLHAEEDTAWAIFTPSTDVLGQANADGHEVDFFTRDSHDRPYFWAYRYDASARTVAKYVYSRPGTPAIIDPASVVNGVASFKSATYTIDKLADASSPIYNPLFAAKTLRPVAIHYGYGSEVAGGNQITTVNFTGKTITESAQLTTQTAPSGWTVRFHYTKAVAAALSVWPKYVIYGANGANVVRTDSGQRFTVAAIVNGILGGGIAQALTTCKARAFTDVNFSVPDATVSFHDPTSGDPVTGCYDGHIEAVESGYSGNFNMYPGTCGRAVVLGVWSPTIAGKAAASSAAGIPFSTCAFAILSSDQTNASTPSQIVMAQAVSGGACSRIGERCAGAANWPTSMDPQCDASGGIIQGGWTGSGRFSVSPPSLGNFNTDGTNWTFDRTALGTVNISAEAASVSYSVVNGACKGTTRYSAVDSWTLN